MADDHELQEAAWDDQQSTSSAPAEATASSSVTSDKPAAKRADTFPVRLHAMLEQAEEKTRTIVSWQPNGLCFKVHDKNAFVRDILPRWFKRQTQFASFQRQLNIYGFKQNTKVGKNMGAYQHPHFMKGKPQLVHLLERVEVKGAEAARENQYRAGDRKRKLGESHPSSRDQEARTDAAVSRMDSHEPRLLVQSAAILRSIPETLPGVNALPAPLPAAIGPIRNSAAQHGGLAVLDRHKPHVSVGNQVHNSRIGEQRMQLDPLRITFPSAPTDTTQTNLRLLDCATLASDLGEDVNELLELFGKPPTSSSSATTTLTAATIQAAQNASLHPAVDHSSSSIPDFHRNNHELGKHHQQQGDRSTNWTDQLLQFGWNSGDSSPAEVDLEPTPLKEEPKDPSGYA